MGDSYDRLKTKFDKAEAENAELRKAVARALTDGAANSEDPGHQGIAGAAAELIAKGVRGDKDAGYRKATEKVGHHLPPAGIGGVNLGDDQSERVKKIRAGDDVPADNHDLTARIRKAAAKRKKEEE